LCEIAVQADEATRSRCCEKPDHDITELEFHCYPLRGRERRSVGCTAACIGPASHPLSIAPSK
jgi:hypothetical protein